jgi:hypothetical protein
VSSTPEHCPKSIPRRRKWKSISKPALYRSVCSAQLDFKISRIIIGLSLANEDLQVDADTRSSAMQQEMPQKPHPSFRRVETISQVFDFTK